MKQRILCLLLILCAGFFLFPQNTQAADIACPPDSIASGTCGDGLGWAVRDNGQLYIYMNTFNREHTMNPYSYSDGESSAPWFEYRNQITSISVSGAKSIGNSAFAGLTQCKTVSIPDTVSSIGSKAFSNCPALESITVSDSNPAYKSVNDVLFTKDGKTLIQYPISKTGASYSIPNGVEIVGWEAFRNVANLTSVSMPDTVKTVGGHAFRCSGTKHLTISHLSTALTTAETYAFFMCNFPETTLNLSQLTALGQYAFSSTTFNTVLIGNKLNTIETKAFYQSEFSKAVIGSSVTRINGQAFAFCKISDGVYFCGGQPNYPEASSTFIASSGSYQPVYVASGYTHADVYYDPQLWSDEAHATVEGTFHATTCKEGAYTEYSCQVCGFVRKAYSSAASDHSWSEWQTTASPTCTEEGSKTRSCQSCQATETDSIPMLSHSPATTAAKAPTCTASGLSEGSHCSICKKVLAEQEIIPATQHKNRYSGESKDSSCTVDGHTAGVYCPDCDTWLTAQESIPATGHSYSNPEFLWSADLISATASAQCYCSHADTVDCTLTWVHSATDQLTVTAWATFGTDSFSESKDISVFKDGDTIIVTLPDKDSSLQIIAAAYDSSNQMSDCRFAERSGNTAAVTLSGPKICLFFLSNDFQPVSPPLFF